MKVNGLGTCVGLSLLLNLAGFAPMMHFLLSRPGGNVAPPARTQIQVRMVKPERPQVRSQLPPPPRPQTPPPKVQPVAEVAARQPVKPSPAEVPKVPQNSVPQAPQAPSARPRGSAPIRTLGRPDSTVPGPADAPASGPVEPYRGPGPASGPDTGAPPPNDPGPVTTPPPEPPPAPDPSPPPAGPISSTAEPALPPPASQGPEPQQGVIPDKPAMPKTNPPNANSRIVLRKIGGKSFIRLQVRVFPDGHIEPEVLVSSGVPELDQAVLRDLTGWRWDPAEVAGKPVLTEKPIKLKLEAD